jgi:hypothetical protein
VLTPDQITAVAPDAASLKAGRDLGTPRKWESIGGDHEVLWGLAMGSGKDPYQTRVRIADLASKCSCPSRKFPCKHAIGLMFLATSQPDALNQKDRPPWVVEWLDAHVAREQKAEARAQEKEAKPVDEKAAAKRHAQRENRVQEGAELLQRTLLDLTREGLASGAARSAGAWETLAKRMVDSQAPGLAGALRHIADTVLRDPDVEVELPFEMGRLHLLLKTFLSAERHPEPLNAELLLQLGGRSATNADSTADIIEDQWFVAGRSVEERDRLITSSTWILGKNSRRWGRVLRFAPAMQAIVDPWPLGSEVSASLKFQAGLYPLRGIPDGDGSSKNSRVPAPEENDLQELLDRFTSALTANPFLRALPFFIPLRPSADTASLVDATHRSLPWHRTDDLAFRVECICAGNPTPVCGEWDGRRLRLLSILDGDAWIPLTPQQP